MIVGTQSSAFAAFNLPKKDYSFEDVLNCTVSYTQSA